MYNFCRSSPGVDRIRLAGIAVLVAFSFLAGCGQVGSKTEYAYVASPEVVLRDQVAQVYTKTGIVHNGERVQVLERMQGRRFVRVRSSRGEEGWVQDRYLTDQQTYDQLQKLEEQFKNTPAQAVAITRAQVNLHAIPGRKTEHLYQLNENEKVDLLGRQVADRNATPPKKASDSDSSEEQAGATEKPGQEPVWEDWWLVRDSKKRAGWVLARMLYVDVPIDIAQYAEGQRLVGFFLLDQVKDGDNNVSEYLVLLSENKDGQPYDFDQIRVFTWNIRRHRYETAYREHGLAGFLPVTVGRESFEKEGELRTFTVPEKDREGQLHQVKYKFNPPIVRRVTAAIEQPLPRKRAKGKR